MTLLGALLALMAFLPSLIYVMFGQSSLAPGMAISAGFVLIVGIAKLNNPRFNIPSTIGWASLFLLLVVSVTIHGLDSTKAILSLPLLAILVAAANVFARLARQTGADELRSSTLGLVVVFLLVGGLGAVVPFVPAAYAPFSGPIFPFSEPSHFALTAGPLFILTGIFCSEFSRKALIALVIALSLSLPSLVLASYAVLMLLIHFRPTKALFLISTFAAISFAVIYNSEYLLTYFSDRLDFSQDNANLTALVYIQGWSEAYRALVETHGTGVGFQKLGTLSPSVVSERIFELAGQYKNLEDGGFLLAKLIGEFGVVGIMLVCLYLIACVRAFQDLTSKSARVRGVATSAALAHRMGSILLLGFLPEMLLRGYGYFSPGVFLVLIGVFLTSSTSAASRRIAVSTLLPPRQIAK